MKSKRGNQGKEQWLFKVIEQLVSSAVLVQPVMHCSSLIPLSLFTLRKHLFLKPLKHYVTIKSHDREETG